VHYFDWDNYMCEYCCKCFMESNYSVQVACSTCCVVSGLLCDSPKDNSDHPGETGEGVGHGGQFLELKFCSAFFPHSFV